MSTIKTTSFRVFLYLYILNRLQFVYDIMYCNTTNWGAWGGVVVKALRY